MKWKINSNLIVILVFSIAYTVVTLLNIIGPLHMNSVGNINKLSAITVYSIIYWILALLISWVVYFRLRKKPEILFFTLLILGMSFIMLEVFLWGWIGS